MNENMDIYVGETQWGNDIYYTYKPKNEYIKGKKKLKEIIKEMKEKGVKEFYINGIGWIKMGGD